MDNALIFLDFFSCILRYFFRSLSGHFCLLSGLFGIQLRKFSTRLQNVVQRRYDLAENAILIAIIFTLRILRPYRLSILIQFDIRHRIEIRYIKLVCDTLIRLNDCLKRIRQAGLYLISQNFGIESVPWATTNLELQTMLFNLVFSSNDDLSRFPFSECFHLSCFLFSFLLYHIGISYGIEGVRSDLLHSRISRHPKDASSLRALGWLDVGQVHLFVPIIERVRPLDDGSVELDIVVTETASRSLVISSSIAWGTPKPTTSLDSSSEWLVTQVSTWRSR